MLKILLKNIMEYVYVLSDWLYVKGGEPIDKQN